jgi:antitoxin FitA
MATLTIRDLDDGLKLSLRMRAARHSRSMEEEARQILRQVLQGDTAGPQQDLASRIRARVQALGGVVLEMAPREPGPEPLDFSAPSRRRKPMPPPAAPARAPRVSEPAKARSKTGRSVSPRSHK